MEDANNQEKAEDYIRQIEEKTEVRTSQKSKKNPWMISTVVFAIIAIILLYFVFGDGGITGNVISETDAGDKLVNYLNTRTNGGVTLVSVEDSGNLYTVLVSYQGDEIPVYITKDGEYFVQGVVPMTSQAASPTQPSTQPSQDIPKSDKPVVELFIMTHCPYGTQAEKGIIPVFEALGDNIDGDIRFVHYFMHDPEEDETPIQVCIREEQPEKWLPYLTCFLEDGDSDRCLDEVGIDKAKLNSCISDKSEEYYASDSALSEGYGVRGSPTLVINGQVVSSGRSSSAFLSTICSAFNEPVDACSEELSSANPSPGFGYSASSSGSSNTAQC